MLMHALHTSMSKGLAHLGTASMIRLCPSLVLPLQTYGHMFPPPSGKDKVCTYCVMNSKGPPSYIAPQSQSQMHLHSNPASTALVCPFRGSRGTNSMNTGTQLSAGKPADQSIACAGHAFRQEHHIRPFSAEPTRKKGLGNSGIVSVQLKQAKGKQAEKACIHHQSLDHQTRAFMAPPGLPSLMPSWFLGLSLAHPSGIGVPNV